MNSKFRMMTHAALIGAVLAIVAPAAPAPAQEVKDAKVGIVLSIEGILPLLVASKKGYFDEQKLNYKHFFFGGSRTRDALMGGQVNFGMNHVGSIWPAVQKNLPIKFVAMFYKHSIFGVLIRKDLRNKVRSAKDLRNKTILTFQPGAASQAFAAFYLSTGGLRIDKDVKAVYVSTGDARVWMNAIESGKADALLGVWEPTFTTAVNRGKVFPLLDLSDPKQHDRWVGGNVGVIGIVTTDQIIKNDPDVVLRMIRATEKALAFIHSDVSDSALAELALSVEGVKMNRDVLTRIIHKVRPNFTVDMRISKSAYTRAAEMYTKGGFIEKPIPFEKIADASLAGMAP